MDTTLLFGIPWNLLMIKKNLSCVTRQVLCLLEIHISRRAPAKFFGPCVSHLSYTNKGDPQINLRGRSRNLAGDSEQQKDCDNGFYLYDMSRDAWDGMNFSCLFILGRPLTCVAWGCWLFLTASSLVPVSFWLQSCSSTFFCG